MTQVDFNGAGRIYDILDRARRSDRDGTVRDGWARIFGIEPTDFKLVLQHYAALLNEVDRTIEIFEESSEGSDGNLYIDALVAVRSALNTTNFTAPWSSAQDQITQALMVGLNFCRRELGRLRPEAMIASADLEDIRVQISELVNSLVWSDIEPELKRELIAALQNVQRVIIEYNISGADGLKRAMDTLVGVAVRQHQRADGTQEKDFIRKVVGIVDLLDKVTTFARNVKELYPALMLLIGSGG